MTCVARHLHNALLIIAVGLTGNAVATEIGQIKVSKGDVVIERSGTVIPGMVGVRLQSADVIKTGGDGSFGITFSDNSLLSAGPNSIVSLDYYTFDVATGKGESATTMRKGFMVMASGRIAKQSPDAMMVRTPTAILGVRGTEFAVSVGD